MKEGTAPGIPVDDFTTTKRVVLFIVGNLVPSVLLLASARNHALRVTWQSGKFHDYAALLLSGKCGWVFYPFFIYAVACFTLGVMRPRQLCSSRVVLFGVVTGILLGLQTCVLLGIVALHVDQWKSWTGLLKMGIGLPLWAFAAILLPWLVMWLAKWTYSKLKVLNQRRSWLAFTALGGPLLALGLGSWLEEEAFSWVVMAFLIPMAGVLAGGPFWMLAAYVIVAVDLLRFRETRLRYRLADLLGIFVWLSAYLAAWRFALEQVVETYAQLPTAPPSDCYVATAAARGHPRFVRSLVTQNSSGATIVVTAQLQFLKCGELILRTECPRLHRFVRSIYDSFGPCCARAIRHPIAADFAYVSLKPMEWCTRAAIQLIVPRVSTIAHRLYVANTESGSSHRQPEPR